VVNNLDLTRFERVQPKLSWQKRVQQEATRTSRLTQYGFAIKSAAMAHVQNARVRDSEYGAGASRRWRRRREENPNISA
jgi:hypothetical protein